MIHDEMPASEANNADQIHELTAVNRRLRLENEALIRLGQIVSSAAGIDAIYEKFSQELQILIPFDRLSISLLNSDADQFTVAYTAGVNTPDMDVGNTFPVGASTFGEVVRTRSGRVVQGEFPDDLQPSNASLSEFAKEGLHSFLFAPMVTREQFVGIIVLGACIPGFYNSEHLKLVERVSSPIAGVVSILQLYEERAQLQSQLFHAQKMEAIGRLAGGIAHDFNNLLTPIIGFSQVGMKCVPPTDRARIHFQRINEASERASQLVRQLLTFSRKEFIEAKPGSLSKVIAGMDAILRRLLGENIRLITRPRSDLHFALMDKGLMEQVLVNLVVNARDALPNGGRIIIETDNLDVNEHTALAHPDVSHGEYVRMSVRDNGVGMSEDVMSKIFDPFFTTKEQGMGTGLGLSVCYGIVKQIEGHIFVDSEPEQGTTVTIYLPSIGEGLLEEAREVREAMASPKIGTETLLLVEDDLAVREIAVYILQEYGYTVLEAANGTEALQILRDLSPENIDLLFTDVVLPGMAGKDLSNAVREPYPDAKVLYCSGYANETIARYGLLDGGVAFLQKPFRPDELASKVREVLDAD